MTQTALFADPSTTQVVNPAGHPISAGAKFVFHGLPGQEPYETRLPSSGSIGWVIEICSISPTGSLGIMCSPDIETPGRVSSVAFADALAMVEAGIWEPLSR